MNSKLLKVNVFIAILLFVRLIFAILASLQIGLRKIRSVFIKRKKILPNRHYENYPRYFRDHQSKI